MALYRKKPVVIEAITFEEFIEYGKVYTDHLVDGMPWHFEYKGYPVTHANDECYIIPTLEGEYSFTPKDMLITGIKGEIYPCKKDIFYATYEKVEDISQKPKYAEVCTDNRFELIKKYKDKLIKGTNIEHSKEEMDVIENILFRFWQMGWLYKLEADVVPKGEVERLEKEAERIMREKTALECIVATARNQGKTEVVREILHIIDSIIGADYDDHNEIKVAFMQGAKRVREKIIKKYNITEQPITKDRNT